MGELPGNWPCVVGDDLAFAKELPFVDHQAVEADGPAWILLVLMPTSGSSLLLPKGVGVPRLPLTAHPEIRMIGTELLRCGDH